MKYFYIIANDEKGNVEHSIRLISEYLRGRGCECRIGKTVKRCKESPCKYTNAEDVPDYIQCVIVLGGDGTMIQAARDLSGRNIPMIGINLGTLGYMTQVSRQEEIIPMLNELIGGHFELEERMMLKGIVRAGETVVKDIALNDIVVTRGGALRSLKFDLYINDEIFNDYTADGMIIATPTGSTAYNLSAGGPIAAPVSNMIILTPICPHTLNSRSIVLSSKCCIKIQMKQKTSGDQSVVFDGDTIVELMAGDSITIERSELKTIFIKMNHVSFLDNLRNKMAQI